MLCIGLGIVFVPPMVIEVVSSYYPHSEIVEHAVDNQLMKSTFPTLSLALLILGLVELVVRGLLKK